MSHTELTALTEKKDLLLYNNTTLWDLRAPYEKKLIDLNITYIL